MGLRFMTAALFFTILALTGAVRLKLSLSSIRALLPVSLLQPVLYFTFETIGIDLTSSSESSIIIALVPIAITVCAAFFLKERLLKSQWFSAFVSVLGVIIITAQKSNSEGGSRLSGVLLLLGAVLSAGLYNVLSKKVSADYTPSEITFVMMWVGAIIFNLVGIAESAVKNSLPEYFAAFADPKILVDLLYLGILSSIAAYFLLNYSLSKLEASKSAVFFNLTPIVSVAAGIFLRGEEFFFLQFVGAVIVLIGVWGVNRKGVSRKGAGSVAQGHEM